MTLISLWKDPVVLSYLDPQEYTISEDREVIYHNGEVLVKRILVCNVCDELIVCAPVYVNQLDEKEEMKRILNSGGECGKCGSVDLSFKAIDTLLTK